MKSAQGRSRVGQFAVAGFLLVYAALAGAQSMFATGFELAEAPPFNPPPPVLCTAADPRCGAAYDPAHPMSAGELAQAIQAGMAAWRFHGTRGACSGCHLPDALDLAMGGFSDDSIRRRSSTHIDPQRAEAVVNLVRAIRQKFELTTVFHPAALRPLQPGFEPFHETTPGLPVWDSAGQRERDQAFTDHLVNGQRLLWATGRVDSLPKARQAYDELRAINLRRLKLGIPFDLFSEDGFYGETHKSVFEWFPDIASTPNSGMDSGFYALVDAYIANPTDANLWAYYDAVSTHTACDPDLGGADIGDYARACNWMRLKYRSLQFFGHLLRRRDLKYPDFLADLRSTQPQAHYRNHLDTVIARNPVWEAGDLLRIAPLQRPAATACNQTNHPCTLLPPIVDVTVHNIPTPRGARIKQSEVFQQSWFVMSWLADPALLYEGDSFATFIGDYLESVLLPYYDVHHAFVVAKMAVEKSAASEWMNAPGFRQGTGKIASVRTFSFKQLRDNFSPPPQNDPRYPVHARMFANFARMWIYLVEEDVRVSGSIYHRTEVMRAVRFMRTWIVQLEGQEDAQINALVGALETSAAAATELRTQQNISENPGTGLQPNGRWAEFDTPYVP
ncbi:hypothetical protein [Tahibacter sp.]|uniref:hypothetical protein n=1 Tax=Tahibacter sp. TaxID=2056211 RepID=UPI0028C42540|nr:hypothetical protein [Tahibacter sp.]